MKTYDCIVVGSGIAGLTAARVLSQHRKSVLLLEKATILGGSLARFRVEGIPYDVGFHFTGGFTGDSNGVLDSMLSIMGVRDQIRPIFFPREASHHMIFPTLGVSYDIPSGIQAVHDKLKRDFPSEKIGLERYFKRFNDVVAATPTLTFTGFDDFPPPISEDEITLQEVLDECVQDKILQTILGGLCMCYGTCPNQVSFATHARVCFGLQESLARVENGGDAFVDALVNVLRRDNVDIRTRTTIQQCVDVKDRQVQRFILTDGTEVMAKNCVFTIHPRNILATLPKEHLSKAFQMRVNDFEASNAFFTLYGVLDTPSPSGAISLVSVLPDVDLNEALTCHSPEPVDGPLMVLRSREAGDRGPVHTVTALEVAFIETTEAWNSTKLKRRPPEYYAYKQERAESIVKRMHQHLPECRPMRVVDTASSLTYRDYLHSPDGSAYGIRQKIGQFNVVGRLPLRNIYAAGQGAILPGVLGAMMSALFVCRNLLGRPAFAEYIGGRPCLDAAQ